MKLGWITGSVLLALVTIGALTVWWAVTDIGVRSWPKRIQIIYARGAIEDYLDMRCIAPMDVRLVDDARSALVGETRVDAYTPQADSVTVWEIATDLQSYPVMVSVFPDAQYAVTWWYDVTNPSRYDTYVSSSVWEHPDATRRMPVSDAILEQSGMNRSDNCDD